MLWRESTWRLPFRGFHWRRLASAWRARRTDPPCLAEAMKRDYTLKHHDGFAPVGPVGAARGRRAGAVDKPALPCRSHGARLYIKTSRWLHPGGSGGSSAGVPWRARRANPRYPRRSHQAHIYTRYQDGFALYGATTCGTKQANAGPAPGTARPGSPTRGSGGKSAVMARGGEM